MKPSFICDVCWQLFVQSCIGDPSPARGPSVSRQRTLPDKLWSWRKQQRLRATSESLCQRDRAATFTTKTAGTAPCPAALATSLPQVKQGPAWAPAGAQVDPVHLATCVCVSLFSDPGRSFSGAKAQKFHGGRKGARGDFEIYAAASCRKPRLDSLDPALRGLEALACVVFFRIAFRTFGAATRKETIAPKWGMAGWRSGRGGKTLPATAGEP